MRKALAARLVLSALLAIVSGLAPASWRARAALAIELRSRVGSLAVDTSNVRLTAEPGGIVRARVYATTAGVLTGTGPHWTWSFRSLRLTYARRDEAIVPANPTLYGLGVTPRLAVRSGGATLATLASGDGVSLSLGLATPVRATLPAVMGQVAGDTATYPGAFSSSTDVALRTTTTGLDLRLVLRSAADVGLFAITVAATATATSQEGATTAQAGPLSWQRDPAMGAIVANRPSTECGDSGCVRSRQQEYAIGPAIVRDAAGIDSGSVRLALTPPQADGSGAGDGPRRITLTLDPAWLRAAGRRYPLLVDLPIATTEGNGYSWQAGTLSSCRPDQPAVPGRLVVGVDQGCTYRGLLAFNLVGLPFGYNSVVAARLVLNTPEASGPSAMLLYPVLLPQNASSTAPARWGDVVPEDGVAGLTEMASTSQGTWQSWDVTALARDWLRQGFSGAVTLVRLDHPLRISSPLLGDDPPDRSPYLDLMLRTGSAPAPEPQAPRAKPPLAAAHTGGAPSSVAVDERRHRAFVANAEQCTPTASQARSSISMVDTRDGRLIATTRLPFCLPLWSWGTSRARAEMAVASGAGRLIVLGRGSSAALLDAESGALLKSVILPGTPEGVVVDERRSWALIAYEHDVGGYDTGGGIVVLDARGGRLVRRYSEPIGPTALAVDARTGRIFAAGPTPDGFIRVPGGLRSTAGSLLVIDTATGILLRRLPLGAPDPTFTSYDMVAAEAVRRVFVADQGLLALDSATGAVVTRVAGTGTIVGLSSVPGVGAIVVTSPLGGQLRSALSGALITSFVVGANPQLQDVMQTVDPATGLIYLFRPFAVSGSKVLALDPFTDRFVAGYFVHGSPAAVAIDDTTGHAVVAAGIDDITSLLPLANDTPQVIRGTPVDPVAPTCCGARFFPHHGHNLYPPFYAFWQAHGGVTTLGYPLTDPIFEDGHPVQYTERARLDLGDDGRVTLAPLGVLLAATRGLTAVAPASVPAGSLFFARTGHSLGGRFLIWWRTHDGATLLGAPISEPLVEANGDGSGRRYLLQWFENGRLEYHPELAGTRYAMELGLLGVQALQQRGWLLVQ